MLEMKLYNGQLYRVQQTVSCMFCFCLFFKKKTICIDNLPRHLLITFCLHAATNPETCGRAERPAEGGRRLHQGLSLNGREGLCRRPGPKGLFSKIRLSASPKQPRDNQ